MGITLKEVQVQQLEVNEDNIAADVIVMMSEREDVLRSSGHDRLAYLLAECRVLFTREAICTNGLK